jgi:uncharacterized membrane protein
MIRRKAALVNKRANNIVWRSHEPVRLETFSDAVFAFALTLIIVSIEVPKSFDDLLETMKGTVSFGVCFALLFQIWNNQNLFFRRYGLKDPFTTVLNAFLLFVVLIYTYPLKFLSMVIFSFSNETYTKNGHQYEMIRQSQVQPLMLIYGAGFLVIYFLFYLMYVNAQKFAVELNLTETELFETVTVKSINLICICICLCAISLALLFPSLAGLTGFVYCAIPFAYSFWFGHRGKKLRKLNEAI